MYISSRYTDEDWKNLDLDNENSSDWCIAIEIIDERIRGRYLDPVDELIELDNKRAAKDRRFGFTILAIDCIIVETLQVFIEGGVVGNTRERFVNFLTKRPSFSEHFDKQLACRFYDNFRNGLLHEAETRSGGLVWSVGQLLDNTGTGMTINRTKFHEALKDEFDFYLTELEDTKCEKLRKNFRNQMDSVVNGS